MGLCAYQVRGFAIQSTQDILLLNLQFFFHCELLFIVSMNRALPDPDYLRKDELEYEVTIRKGVHTTVEGLRPSKSFT